MNANETTTNAQSAAVAEQHAQVAPETAASPKGASQERKSPQAQKGAKEAAAQKGANPASNKASKRASKPTAKKAAKPTKPANDKAAKAATPKPVRGQPRTGSKKQIVLEMLHRKNGATLAEIAEATGWQNNSIRGFISTMTKNLDLPIASLKNAAGDRFFRIEK